MTAIIRPAHRADQAFVSNSWASALLGPRAGWGGNARSTNGTIDRLLDDARTKVLIACELANEDSIIGWVAFARIPGARVLEFVMVRRQRRNEGIASKLLSAAELLGTSPPLVYLYSTPDVKHLPPGTLMEPGDFL